MQEKNVARYALMVVFIFVLTVIQTTVLHSAEVFGVIPNLLLSCVVCYSLIKGDPKAIVFGIVCGLVLDFFGGRTVGINTLLCMYTALLCVLLHGGLFNNNALVAMLFVFVISLLYELLIYFFNIFIWGYRGIWYALVYKILFGSVYTALTALLIYPVLKLLAEEWLPKPRRRNFLR